MLCAVIAELLLFGTLHGFLLLLIACWSWCQCLIERLQSGVPLQLPSKRMSADKSVSVHIDTMHPLFCFLRSAFSFLLRTDCILYSKNYIFKRYCIRQITTPAPHHSIFMGRMLFLHQTNSAQAMKAILSLASLKSGSLIYICGASLPRLLWKRGH